MLHSLQVSYNDKGETQLIYTIHNSRVHSPHLSEETAVVITRSRKRMIVQQTSFSNSPAERGFRCQMQQEHNGPMHSNNLTLQACITARLTAIETSHIRDHPIACPCSHAVAIINTSKKQELFTSEKIQRTSMCSTLLQPWLVQGNF